METDQQSTATQDQQQPMSWLTQEVARKMRENLERDRK